MSKHDGISLGDMWNMRNTPTLDKLVKEHRMEHTNPPDCGQAAPCTQRITSVSSLVLENHRMVDTADERLGLILCTLIEKLHGDASCSGVVDSTNNHLPTASIPLLDDMLTRQENNNRVIESILEIIEKDL